MPDVMFALPASPQLGARASVGQTVDQFAAVDTEDALGLQFGQERRRFGIRQSRIEQRADRALQCLHLGRALAAAPHQVFNGQRQFVVQRRVGRLLDDRDVVDHLPPRGLDAFVLQVLDQRVHALVHRDGVEVGLGLDGGQLAQVIGDVKVECVATGAADLDEADAVTAGLHRFDQVVGHPNLRGPHEHDDLEHLAGQRRGQHRLHVFEVDQNVVGLHALPCVGHSAGGSRPV